MDYMSANFPAYELASMTPKQVEQVTKRLPHHSARAFYMVWLRAMRVYDPHFDPTRAGEVTYEDALRANDR